jgi:hypothetical protein
MFGGKRAYIHHPVVAIIVGFLLGMLVMFLIARGVIPVQLNVCP